MRHILLAALVCTVGQTTFAAHNQLTEAQKKAGWQLLFDGQTTRGWRNYRQEGISDGWVVEEGVLVRKERGAGDIITTEQFGSFELVLEYRISPGGNSGLMFHVQETEAKAWQTGPELQILDNAKGRDAQKSGWLYGLYQPPDDPATGTTVDATRPAGEWNQIHLRVTPEQCEINMNGVRYARFNKGTRDWNERVAKSKFADYKNFGKPAKGHICLQDHNDEVAFRNVRLRELPSGGSLPDPVDGELAVRPVRAFPNLKWDGWEPVDERGRVRAFRPILVTDAPGVPDRLFVVEQHGEIYSFENRPDVTDSQLFLDLKGKVQYSDRQNEEGLLGAAFHPKYHENGQVFVYYTEKPGMVSVISRFTASKSDPHKADPASEEELLRIEQPFWNHNGGTIAFGPDGYLYVGLGDGGAGNDPHDNGQNLETLLGSILRIDVDNRQGDKAYAIPRDNPFLDRDDARPEIYAYGLRNVWRMAFDRETGMLWCGDVGQNLWEEINIIEKGGNYGWARLEGNHPFGAQSPEAGASFIDPVWEYDHEVGKSITGGLVYRGTRLPELVGKYVYADYVSGKIWALAYDPQSRRVLSNEAIPSDQMPIISFGEDAAGEIYFCIVSPTGQGIYTLEKK